MPGDVAKWLSQGVDAYLEGQPLEQALDLVARQGKRNEHPRTRLRIERRDHFIRQALETLHGERQAERLASWFRQLDGVELPDTHARGHVSSLCPDMPVPTACVITPLLQLKASLPLSGRQICRIVSGYRSL